MKMNRLSKPLAVAMALLVLSATSVWADELAADGDGVAPVTRQALAFGSVACGVATHQTALIAVERDQGGSNAFENGSTVTISVLSVSGPGLSASMAASNTISMPADWGSQAKGTLSAAVASQVTVNSSVEGAGAGSVTYRASGINGSNGSAITRDDTMLVSWNTATCAVPDTTPPVLTATVSPLPNAAGWNKSTPVQLTWDVVDTESAVTVDDGCVDEVFAFETAGEVRGCTASSEGGQSTESVTVRIDATKPVISGSAAPQPNTNGWNNTSVVVSFSCAESGSVQSGLATDTVAGGTLSAEGSGQSLTNTGACADNAGNVADAAAVSGINIDKTAPNAPTASPDRAADYSGGGGWYLDTVTVSFSHNGDPDLAPGDPGSGVDPASIPAPVVRTASGSHLVSGTVWDLADNESAAGSVTVQVDATDPTVGFTNCPTNPLVLGTVASADWTAADAHSGLATAASGSEVLDTSSVGPGSVVVGATDNVGRSAQQACNFSVVYSFGGFQRPVDNPTVVNVVKAGQTVPLKWRVTDAAGDPVLGLAGATIKVSSLSCSVGSTTDLLEEGTAGASGFQELGDGYYRYNWRTPTGYAMSCKTLMLDLGDGSDEYIALFQFTR